MDYEAVAARLYSPSLLYLIRAVISGTGEHGVSAAAATREVFWRSLAVAFVVVFAAMALSIIKGSWRTLVRCAAEKHQQMCSLATTGEPVKMVLIVRKDLKMGNGKVAAQCAHAAVAMVEQVIALKSGETGSSRPSLDSVSALWVQWYDSWKASGSTKVALQCPDEATMLAVAKHARHLKLPHYVIRDAGRTQVAPGSKTVLAVGPGPKSLVDEVAGQLKLL